MSLDQVVFFRVGVVTVSLHQVRVAARGLSTALERENYPGFT